MNLDLDSTESWVDWIVNIDNKSTTGTTATNSSSNVVTTDSTTNNWRHVEFDPQTKQEFEQVLKKFDYIQLPSYLDMSNETVLSALAEWYQALEQLKLKHQQLVMLSKLTQDHD